MLVLENPQAVSNEHNPRPAYYAWYTEAQACSSVASFEVCWYDSAGTPDWAPRHTRHVKLSLGRAIARLTC